MHKCPCSRSAATQLLVALCVFTSTAEANLWKRGVGRVNRTEALENIDKLHVAPPNAFFLDDADTPVAKARESAAIKVNRKLSERGPDASVASSNATYERLRERGLLTRDLLEPRALSGEPELWDEMDDGNAYWRQIRRDQAWQFGGGKMRFVKRAAVRLQPWQRLRALTRAPAAAH